MSATTDRENDSWEKITIKDNLYRYRFLESDKHMFNSIFVFVDGERKKALILDTAFPEYAEKVNADLAENGIQPEIVLLSHYHPDHSAGAAVFAGLPLYAGRHYENNHFNCQRWEPTQTFLKPTNLLNDGDTLTFGGFHLEFMEAPGHCECLMMTLIDKELLHIADLLMFGADDRPALPYVSMGGGFKQHIASLERLKTMEYNSLLISHGPVLTDKEKIREEIDDRVHYLRRMLDSEGALPVEQCVKKDVSHYAHTEYHSTNQLQVMVEM
jgi:glyoxylase-like metal-dependent hydrolase (beta-lactamase superfamily II)